MLSALSGEKGGHFTYLSIVTMAKRIAKITSHRIRNTKSSFSEL